MGINTRWQESCVVIVVFVKRNIILEVFVSYAALRGAKRFEPTYRMTLGKRRTSVCVQEER